MSYRKRVRSPEVTSCVRIRNDLLDHLEPDEATSTQISNFAYRVFFLRVLIELDLIASAEVESYIAAISESPDPSAVLSPAIRNLSLFTNTPSNLIKRNSVSKADLTGMANSIVDIRVRNPLEGWAIDPRIYLLCELFEVLKSRRTRKEKGLFYTPPWLAREIARLVVSMHMRQVNERTAPGRQGNQSITDLRILDNACGSGVFLLASFDALLTHYAFKEDTPRLSHSVTPEKIVRRCLFGSDIDPRAIEVTDALLWTALQLVNGFKSSLNLIGNSLFTGDSLIQNRFTDQFHLIVGNPPYFRLSRLDSKYREMLSEKFPTTREYNAHALFVEASIRALRKGGYLGLLLHKNLFTLDTYSELRKYILESHELCSMVDCGPGIFSQVTAETCVLVLRKGFSSPKSELKLMECNTPQMRFDTISSISLKEYSEVVHNWNFRYILRVMKSNIDLLLKLAELPTLSSRVSISRGIETGSNSRFLSQTKRGPSWKPVIRGRDIQRFQLRNEMFIDYNLDKLAKPGRPNLMEIPKVVIRQNATNPIAAFDSGSRLVLNSVTYLANASPDLLKSLCILLNSKFVGWFFQLVLTNNSKVTVNILPNNLGVLPIPSSIDTRAFSRLFNIVAELGSKSSDYSDPRASCSRILDPVSEVLVLDSYFPGLMSSPGIEDAHRLLTSPLATGALVKRILNEDLVSQLNDVAKRGFSCDGFSFH